MTSSGQTLDEIDRKRHLDALFADEPYLSPTMKARSMHEKMRGMRSMEEGDEDSPYSDVADVMPIPATVPRQTVQSTVDKGVARSTSTSDRAVSTAPKLDFDEARAILRGHGVPDPYGFDPTDPLSYFRTQILSEWLQKVEPMEIKRLDPGSYSNSSAAAGARGSLLNADERKG